MLRLRRCVRWCLIALLALLLPLPAAAAEPPTLVKEIAGRTLWDTGSAPHDLVSIANVTYFSADNGSNGAELWRSDGTAQGTRMVADIVPGFAGSDPRFMVAMGDVVYFAASNGTSTNARSTVWRSDGTPQGTRQLADLQPGSPNPQVHNLLAVGAALYILVDDGYASGGHVLWKSDGAAQGTTKLATSSWVESAARDQHRMVSVNNRLFFLGSSRDQGTELWVSDGTVAGTHVVKDINPGGQHSTPTNLVAVGNQVFFTAEDADSYDLWVSDGSEAGTRSVKDISAGGEYRLIDRPVAALGKLAMILVRRETHAGGPDTFVQELWTSDGTVAGTRKVTDLGAPPPPQIGLTQSNYQLAAFNTSLLLLGRDLDGSGWTILRSDGTSQGTQPITQQPTGTLDLNTALVVAGGKGYFVADNGTHGRELWQTSGNPNGTTMVHDIRPGSASPFLQSDATAFSPVLTVLQSSVWFAADGGDGVELWISNGTATGTRPVQNINRASTLR